VLTPEHAVVLATTTTLSLPLLASSPLPPDNSNRCVVFVFTPLGLTLVGCTASTIKATSTATKVLPVLVFL
jgi:hypothetical protein